jgi:soluble lytic murein transglycosylase-like protein
MVAGAAAKPVVGATKGATKKVSAGTKKGIRKGGRALRKGLEKGGRGIGKGTRAAGRKASGATRSGVGAARGRGGAGPGGARPGSTGPGGGHGPPGGPGRGRGRPSGRPGGPRLRGRGRGSPATRPSAADGTAGDDAAARAAGASLRAAGRVAGAAGRLVRSRLSPRRLLRLRRRARRREKHRRKKKATVSISMPVMLCGLVTLMLTLGMFGGNDDSPGWSNQGLTAGEVVGIPYADLFNKTKEQGIDPRLLAAVAWVETNGFTPGIIDCTQATPTGRLGIMQVPPGIARDLEADPCDPADAIPLGADLLVKLFEQHGSWPAAITAFHMLPDADGNIPDEDPTAPGGYLEKVKATWDQYKATSALDAGVVSGIPYADIFNATAALGIDPRLVAAVAWQESIHFDPDVIACRRDSPKGAKGIMQFMPATAAGRGVDPCKPESAIPGGAKYLLDLFEKFGSWPLAIAAYNAGAGAVEQYGGIPPFEETQKYVPAVMAKWEEYKKQFPSGSVEGSDGQWALPGPRALLDRNPRELQNPHHDYPAWDWGIPTGTPIYAVRSGTVAAVYSNPYNCYEQDSCRSCGIGVTITDADGNRWTYCHGSQQLTAEGAKVQAGTQILVSGNSGNSSGPHLHIEIRVNGQRQVCPQSLIAAIYNRSSVPDPRNLPSSGCISRPRA